MNELKITLAGRFRICENTYAFVFDTGKVIYDFKAGQYAYFTILNPSKEDYKGNTRPLSVAGAPGSGEIIVALRAGNSVFFENLMKLSIGDELTVSEPHGIIHSEKIIFPAVFIAGGIGVTPFRSIAEKFVREGNDRDVRLIHLNRGKSLTPFHDDFKEWSDEGRGFRYMPVFADIEKIEGPGKDQIIEAVFGDQSESPSEKHFYLAGSPQMVNDVRDLLKSEGADSQRILSEQFR